MKLSFVFVYWLGGRSLRCSNEHVALHTVHPNRRRGLVVSDRSPEEAVSFRERRLVNGRAPE